MRIGLHLHSVGRTFDDLTAAASQVQVDIVYVNETVGWDPVTLAALIGTRVPGIEVGTAVALTYPRHPQALASSALSAQAATGNRFVLGVGPGHKPAIEERYGIAYDKPAAHVRDYLTRLRPLLEDKTGIPGVTRPKLLLSALGPVMLGIANDLTDGTAIVWTTADGVTKLITPHLHDKEIALTAMVAVTDDPETVRQQLAENLAPVGELPNYRKHLDRQGFTNAVETAIIGDEKTVRQEVWRLEDAGVTELVVSVAGDPERTMAALR